MFSIYFVLLFVDSFKISYGGGESYALTFMNITSDGEDNSGFTQIFVYSNNFVRARILAINHTFPTFIEIGANMGLIYNHTEDFVTNKVIIANEFTKEDELGISVYSGSDVSIIGVKSDRGSTDAFLALRIVTSSKEYVVALWPNKAVFQGSIQIIGVLNGTCVEVYKIFEGSKFVPVHFDSIDEYGVLRFFQRFKIDQHGKQTNELEDLTGYYVNASRPVRVIVGHECANVPEKVGYCDHIAEQIPALAQLGRRHLVPPIAGRRLNAGYIIRVVGAQKGSSSSVKVGSYTQKTLRFGEYLEVDVPNNMDAILVTCDTNCLVMQYNKGFATIDEQTDTPTDPFMMAVTASDRFTDVASFATPSYCDKTLNRINFDNYASVVTFSAYRDFIFYDGQQLTKTFPSTSWKQVEELSVISFKISHGFHVISSSMGSFAAYVYGHSILTSSPSGYGFAANYNVSGESVDLGWKISQDLLVNYLLVNPSKSCNNNTTNLETIISNSSHASFPILLVIEIASMELPESCISRLRMQLDLASENIRQKINRWICLQLNCSYLSSFVVAIHSFSFYFDKDNQGKYSGITMKVEVIATYEALASELATCRLEIQNYLSYYSNWLSLNQLLAGSSNYGCPSNFSFKNNRLSSNNETFCRNK